MIFSFGQALERTREAKGLTQVQLAEKVGVTKQSINNIEHGVSIPNVKIQGQQLKTVRKPYSDQQFTVLGDKIIESCTVPKHD